VRHVELSVEKTRRTDAFLTPETRLSGARCHQSCPGKRIDGSQLWTQILAVSCASAASERCCECKPWIVEKT